MTDAADLQLAKEFKEVCCPSFFFLSATLLKPISQLRDAISLQVRTTADLPFAHLHGNPDILTLESLSSLKDPKTVVELGSGPGNTAYPLMRSSANPGLYIHAVDYSSTAIDIFRVRSTLFLAVQLARINSVFRPTLSTTPVACKRMYGTCQRQTMPRFLSKKAAQM